MDGYNCLTIQKVRADIFSRIYHMGLKIELDNDNTAKINAVTQSTNLPGATIVNLFMRAITTFDLQGVVTYTVEERSPDRLEQIGKKKITRRKFSIVRNL